MFENCSVSESLDIRYLLDHFKDYDSANLFKNRVVF